MAGQYRSSERYTLEVRRGAYIGRAQPGPFHCLSCKTYVTGTESGHCPRCGFVPPSAPIVVDDKPTPRDAAMPSRQLAIGLAIIVLVVAVWLLAHEV